MGLLPDAVCEPAKAGRQRALKIEGALGGRSRMVSMAPVHIQLARPLSCGPTWPQGSVVYVSGQEKRDMGCGGPQQFLSHMPECCSTPCSFGLTANFSISQVSSSALSDSCIGVSFTDCTIISLTRPRFSHPQCFLFLHYFTWIECSYPFVIPRLCRYICRTGSQMTRCLRNGMDTSIPIAE